MGILTITKVGLTFGIVNCRSCDWEVFHGSRKDRIRSMRMARKHIKDKPGHIVDFEDAYQTTVGEE